MNRVQNQPIAHQPAIYKNVDAVAVHPLHLGARREAGHREGRFFFFRIKLRLGDGRAKRRGNRGNLHQLLQRLPSKELIHAGSRLFRWRAVDDLLRRRRQDELFAGIRQRIVRDQRCDVAELGCVGLQEFPARRHAIKNVGNADRRPRRQSRGLHAHKLSAGEFHSRALAFRFIARFQQQA